MEEDNIEELYRHVLDNRDSLTRPYNRDIIDESQEEVGDIVLSYEALEDIPYRVTRIGKTLDSETVRDGWYNTLCLIDETISNGNQVYVPEEFKQEIMSATDDFGNNSFNLDKVTATKVSNYVQHYAESLPIEEENEIRGDTINDRMKNLVASVPEEATLITLYSGFRNLDISKNINTPLGALSALENEDNIQKLGESLHEEFEAEHNLEFQG